VLTITQITNDAERDWFNSTPSAFRLRFVEVDTLRTLAGHLLDESPEFQDFRAALGEDPAVGSPK
jgi:NTE family protein